MYFLRIIIDQRADSDHAGRQAERKIERQKDSHTGQAVRTKRKTDRQKDSHTRKIDRQAGP
jgi:hypothetical protein